MKNDRLLDKEWLYQEYIVKQKSMHIIAIELNVTTRIVSKYIKRYGFILRTAGESKSLTSKIKGPTTYKCSTINDRLLDKEWLYQKYIVEGLSLRDMMALTSITSRRTIKRALRHHGIPMRNQKDARHNRTKQGKEHRKPNPNIVGKEQYIIDEYTKGRSMRSIYNELNTSRDAVYKILMTANIPIKDCNEINIGRTNTQETKNKMSHTASQQILNGIRSSYAHGTRCQVLSPLDGEITVRSTWEKAYAEHLIKHNIKFRYENTSFTLSDGTRYIPDFYLIDSNEYIEIKGYLSKTQSYKYGLFQQEYPHIKWKLVQKEELEMLGVSVKRNYRLPTPVHHISVQDPSSKPTVYLLIGAPASGKSWVANQLLDKFTYISYDSNPKPSHLDLLLAPSTKPKLYDPTFKISTTIRRHSDKLNFILVAIHETEEILRERMALRGGQWTNTIMNRNGEIKKRFLKYGSNGFSGTSSEVLAYLRSLPTTR